MTTITIITVKEVTRLEKTERVVQKVRVLEKVTVSKGLNSLRCNAHNGPIGPQRPIFLVWADEVPF